MVNAALAEPSARSLEGPDTIVLLFPPGYRAGSLISPDDLNPRQIDRPRLVRGLSGSVAAECVEIAEATRR